MYNAERIAELENDLTLAKAEAAGVTGLLLDVQQDCIALKRQLGNEAQAVIWRDILKERARQDEKYGWKYRPPLRWISILGEEFGEVCRGEINCDWDNYRDELVQVAAVAVAALQNFDDDFIGGICENPTV